MMGKKQFSGLRIRAEKILKACCQQKSIATQGISEVIHELLVYQIELEIQNDDLIETQIELEESRSKYVELYDLAPIGYFSINKEGLIKEVNQAGCGLLGMEKNALINRCFSRYIVSEFQTLFSQQRLRAFKDLSLQSYELKMIKWSQPSFQALLESKVIENSRTGYPQLLMFVTDISSRKLEEETLHQQRVKISSIDRLRSLNELVYGMAQDQNHSLTIIDNYLHGCIRRLESGNYPTDELLLTLKKIVSQSLVLSEIISRRKNFTAKSIFRFEYASINMLLNQTISLITHEMLNFPIIIQYEPTDHLSKVKLDKFHIQQVILNLARNAMEAMKDSNVKEPKILIEITQINSSFIEITLFDNGPGLAQELIPKLFEPHFTTKSYAIGLGLTVSRTIIEKHGGQLFALSNPLGGACFGFTLPCYTA